MASDLSSQGRVFQINISSGGVPKLAVRQAAVTALGLDGDQHRDTVHHGGIERAVCLFSLERILALQAEGHPIFPGAAGENLTLSGMDWEQMTPGRRLRLGSQVELELTRYTEPCANIKPYFIDQDYSRIAQKPHPGWSRVYARVLVPGEITVGESIALV